MTKNFNIISDLRGCDFLELKDRILEQRGIEDYEHFLNPVEEDLCSMEGNREYIDKAIDILSKAFANNSKILIWADVDTDGTTSGAIMYRYLKNYTNSVDITINKGKAHGLVEQDLHRCDGYDVIVIVDSLDKDCEQYKILSDSIGCDVIVLDHHDINPEVPYDNYVCLISSQRNYDNTGLSGAGVCWKFCKEMDKAFGNDFADNYVDLAAVGILADVMPVGEKNYENRYIVKKGLENLTNPGIKKILGSYDFNSKAVLFSIAPLVNASCRMMENEWALQIFIADDNKDLLSAKKKLEACKERQNEEKEKWLPELENIFNGTPNAKVLCGVIKTEYGISGLLGNTLLEEYGRPILVWVQTENGFIGSARSVGYGDFKEIFNSISPKAQGFGHPEAFGVFLEGSAMDLMDFYNALEEKVSAMPQVPVKPIDVDCELTLEQIDFRLTDFAKAFNFVSGNGHKPLTVSIGDITEYRVFNFKQRRHLVLYPSQEGIQIIEWNTQADFEKLEEKALWNDPVSIVAEIDQGFFGRQMMKKLICSEVCYD